MERRKKRKSKKKMEELRKKKKCDQPMREKLIKYIITFFNNKTT